MDKMIPLVFEPTTELLNIPLKTFDNSIPENVKICKLELVGEDAKKGIDIGGPVYVNIHDNDSKSI